MRYPILTAHINATIPNQALRAFFAPMFSAAASEKYVERPYVDLHRFIESKCVKLSKKAANAIHDEMRVAIKVASRNADFHAERAARANFKPFPQVVNTRRLTELLTKRAERVFSIMSYDVVPLCESGDHVFGVVRNADAMEYIVDVHVFWRKYSSRHFHQARDVTETVRLPRNWMRDIVGKAGKSAGDKAFCPATLDRVSSSEGAVVYRSEGYVPSRGFAVKRVTRFIKVWERTDYYRLSRRLGLVGDHFTTHKSISSAERAQINSCDAERIAKLSIGAVEKYNIAHGVAETVVDSDFDDFSFAA